jgi:ammonia channel protein AmtB
MAFLIAAALAAVGLWWRDRLALKHGIDDVTGTIALHGIVGFLGVLLAGFILWMYPASSTADFARINPFGQLVGGMLAFGLFGFLPGYLVSRLLRFLGQLQQSPNRLRGLAFNGKPLNVSYLLQNLLNLKAIRNA